MKEKNMTRREFLKTLGIGSAVAAADLTGCSTEKDSAESGSKKSNAHIPKGKMTYRENPKTGEKVSILGYGCMRWPTMTGANNEEVINQEAVNKLVDKAIEYGVNYFDTSPAYCKGMSEEATGIALSRYPRDKYFIATKLSNFDPSTWSRETSIKMYHDSLRKLRTPYLDYMLLHAVGMGDDGMATLKERYLDNGILDFLLKEREKGKIRNLGFSYHGDIAVFNHLLANHDKYKWDFVQIQMNYLDWKHAREINERNTNAEYLYSELDRRGIPVVIMEPLLGGRLAKVPTHVAERLKTREPERSIASWAFRYCGTMPRVMTVLSGMTYMDNLEDNLRSFCPLKPLDKSELKFLYDTADLIVKYPTVPCNECQYCMPCPYGLNIPAILTHYNKCVNEGNVATDTRAQHYAEARRAFLIGYDRAVPRLRQADHCIGCGHCVPHCPQGIDIPAEMNRIDKYVDSLKQKI